MARTDRQAAAAAHPPFNVVCVAQSGRLQYEALLLAASLRESSPGFAGRLLVAEPQPGGAWPGDPRIGPDIRAALADLGAEIVPFTARHFGAAYPQGNKIECLAAMPEGVPFLFLDTDTLVLGDLAAVPLDPARPAASMRREGTWPVIELYGPGYDAIWGALYARFGLDIAPTLDTAWPADYWRRYLYFNAGWFNGPCPVRFGQRFLDMALAVRDDPPEEAACQVFDPWLDQVVLPLVVTAFGGGRPGPGLAGMDGDVTCHWRTLPLLYARESDHAVAVLERISAPQAMKKLLRGHDPFRRMLYQGKGAKARALFDRSALPAREVMIRNRLKREGLWFR